MIQGNVKVVEWNDVGEGGQKYGKSTWDEKQVGLDTFSSFDNVTFFLFEGHLD